jgi:fibronectin-binding autotransporter adhesin
MKYPHHFRSCQLAAAIAALLAAQAVQAADSSWTTATGPGNWIDAGNWTAGVPGAGNIATFGNTLTGPVTVTVDSNRSIAEITFSNTTAHAFTLSGGNILLASGGTIQTAAGNGVHTDTISTPIEIQGNAGTAAFTANSAASNLLLISGAVTGVSTTGFTTTLTLNGSNTGSSKITGAIGDGGNGGSLAITKAGPGTWVLDAPNTYSGNTTVSGGRLLIANSSALGTGSATVANNANLNLYTLGDATFANAITLNGTGTGVEGALQSSSVGTNELTGLVSLAGNTRINSDQGTFNLSNSGTITGSGYNLTLGGVSNMEIRSVIGTAGGTLTKDGIGTVTLYNSNTYTGATTVSAGVLNIRTNTALGTVAGGVTVNATAGAALELQGNITIGAEALNIGGTGVGSAGALRNISGDNTYGGILTLSAATRINSDAGLLTLSNTGTILGATFGLTVGGIAGSTTINSIIGTTTGGLTKDGPGTLTLTGVNTYTGATTITNGVLSVGSIGNGGTAGNLGKATAASNKLVFDGGTLQYTGTTSTTNRAFIINADKTATIDVTSSTSNLTFSTSNSAPDTGSALTKTGLGTLTLSGDNFHEGATTIIAGTLNVTGSLTTGGTTESAVTVGGAGSTGKPTLAGSGTISGATTIAAAGSGVVGIHSPGGRTTNGTESLVGTQTLESTLNYGAASIFEWQLTSNTADIADRGTAFDGVDVTNGGVSISDAAVFKIVLNSTGSTVDFNPATSANWWDTDRSWQVFGDGLSSIGVGSFMVIDAPTASYTPYYPGGGFSFDSSNGTLNWTAVPEPTGALAWLLVGAGLLRRKRGRKS